MYNNVYDGQSSYCQNPRANAYIFSEYNAFVNECENPGVLASGGVIKSFNDAFISLKKGAKQEATIVSSRSEMVSNNNKFSDFDTNSSISYIPSGAYQITEKTGDALYTALAEQFETDGGCMDNMKITSGDVIITPPDNPETGLAGDADCDGKIYLNDAVLIMQAIGNPDAYGENGTEATHITAKGIENGDVANKGDLLTNADALAVQKYLLHILDKLPELS